MYLVAVFGISALVAATGADVTGLAEVRTSSEPGETGGSGPDPAALVAALEAVAGERVLVVVGPGARIDAIPVWESTARENTGRENTGREITELDHARENAAPGPEPDETSLRKRAVP